MRPSIEEDRQWRQETHDALVIPDGPFKSLYNTMGKAYSQDLHMLTLEAVEGSNKSSESLNAASRVDTPDRRPLKIVETNPQGKARKISIRYRPLRLWMKQDGMKGVGLKILSHLQMAGHWAITIGPYTYDVYQYNGRVMFNAGEWCMDCAGEAYRVKFRHVGSTSKTDREIYTSGMFLSDPIFHCI